MGYSVSWVAVSGAEPRQVLDELGLALTSAAEEVAESPLVCATLPGGWFVVVVDHGADSVLSAEALVALSAIGRVVWCSVDEHAPSSAAAEYSGRAERWRVEHDAQMDRNHLETHGDVPAEFHRMVESRRAEQTAAGPATDVDHLFDAPVMLAQAITGFRHDEDPAGDDPEPFKVLKPIAASSSLRPITRPWWKFW